MRRREQARATGEVLPRPFYIIPLAFRAVWGAHRLARCRVARIHRHQSPAFRLRKEEMGIGHPERLRDPCADEFVERFARGALDHTAEDIGGVAVDELLAGLRRERQRAQALHRRADRLILVGCVPAEPCRRTQPLCLVEWRNQRRCRN